MVKYHIVWGNYTYNISPSPFFSVIRLADPLMGSHLLLHFVGKFSMLSDVLKYGLTIIFLT
jgi:hypothetical protein